MNIYLVSLSALPIITATASAENESTVIMKQKAERFQAQIVKEVKMDYLLFLPKDYGSDQDKKFPLILFLHGAGERGDDLELVRKHGIPKIAEQKDDFPFIAISPQCPADSWWNIELEALNALLDDILGKYAVDKDRIYLTGLSMGGYAAWAMGIKYPDRFAAIVPICGGGDPQKVCAIKDIPVWAFHGAKDSVVKLEQSENMVKALKDCGGNVQLTIYPEADHDSWTATYDNPELYEWLLKQSKSRK